ncbi:10651_t:CDS:2, partial [Cetraspora pellucida]
ESNIEIEMLMEHNSTEDFSEMNSFDNNEDILELSVGKTFQSWDQVASFMKKYTAAKGHRIQISGGEKKNTTTQEIMKQTYLCHHAKKPPNQLNGTSCQNKNCIKVMALNNKHVGYELHPLASCFDPMLRKLPKEIVEEICFLIVVAKADATMQYQVIREKYKTRIYRPDLYNAISRFHHDSEPGKDDMEVLLKRLYEKKIEDPCWVFLVEIDPVTSSLIHLFWMSPDVQSTSHNESENSILKCLFGTSNLSLYELFDALEERYQEENDYYKFINWKQIIPQIESQSIAKTIFKSVVRQLNEFIMSNIIKKQEEQMNLSLHYHAIEINFEVAFSKEKEVDKPDQCIDNLFDCSQVQLSSFITDSLTILEPGVNYVKEFMNKVVSEQSHKEIFSAISKKCKFGELWKLERKIIVDAIEDNNEDFYHELFGFFSAIQKKIKNNHNMSSSNLNYGIGNNVSAIIQNPTEQRLKGRPKKLDLKRIKSVIENFNTKTQYKCKVCKQKDHNSKTYKEKKPLNIDDNQENNETGR